MLEHGGRLRTAALRYSIAEAAWLDLSTGINPNGWPVPLLSADIWQRLPQDDDGLHQAAQTFYGTQNLLAVAGSQAAIQALPALRLRGRVALLATSYAEHAHAWQRYGHEVVAVSAEEISRVNTDVKVIVNPNNPTGKLFTRDELLKLHAQLVKRGGWLVVDEAFMDATPEHSLASSCPGPGLIVLRSLGKFFGLAGARVGFALAEDYILRPLAELLGPWTIAAPSRHVATLALCDSAWQRAMRKALPLGSQRLGTMLSAHGLTPRGGCSLFQWVCGADAASVHQQLAQQGILTRLFEQPSSLRFGLPCDEAQWACLAEALGKVKR
jgi:L-threonine-O-3-phosphate decarboxylase